MFSNLIDCLAIDTVSYVQKMKHCFWSSPVIIPTHTHLDMICNANHFPVTRSSIAPGRQGRRCPGPGRPYFGGLVGLRRRTAALEVAAQAAHCHILVLTCCNQKNKYRISLALTLLYKLNEIRYNRGVNKVRSVALFNKFDYQPCILSINII